MKSYFKQLDFQFRLLTSSNNDSHANSSTCVNRRVLTFQTFTFVHRDESLSDKQMSSFLEHWMRALSQSSKHEVEDLISDKSQSSKVHGKLVNYNHLVKVFKVNRI